MTIPQDGSPAINIRIMSYLVAFLFLHNYYYSNGYRMLEGGTTMKKAIIYQGEFAYNAGNIFTEALGNGLKEQEYEVTYLDLRDRDQQEIARNRRFYYDKDMVLALNAIRPSIDQDDFRYYRDTGCVFIAILIDPPLLQYPRLFFNNDLLTCIDRTHIRFLEQYLKKTIPATVRHLPHGGCFSPQPPTKDRRRFDLFFAGTFTDPAESYRRIEEFPRGLRQVFHDAIELLLKNDNLPVFDALAQAMRTYGLDVHTDREAFNLLVTHYRPLDTYIRAEKRLRTITALDQAGITLHLWGKNWPKYQFKHHRIYAARNLDEINYLMTRSKIVLDLGFYEDGSHERVFTAMLNGAVAVAADNPYHRENFTDGRDICLYQFTRPEQLAESLRQLLADDPRRQAVAAAGKHNAEQHHSWKHRAATLIDYVRQYRQAIPP